MLRAIKYILVAAVLLALAWWVGGLPGNVVAHAGPYTVATSTPAALLILFVIALIFTVLLRVIGGVRRAPGGLSAWRGGRRARLGDVALQRGIVALAAGDALVAQAEAVRTRRLLGDTPMALLLAGEAARLSGDGEQAKAAFAKLTAHKELAFLGHHGLLRHSMASGDVEAAQGHALAAADAYPSSGWLQGRRLELALRQQDWGAALALAKVPVEVAALATQAANTETDKSRALNYARRAVKADPALAAGVVAFAAALQARGKLRAARKVLLAGWKTAPNPLIAAAFLAPLASPIERAQAAAALEAANPGHAESELVLAETSLSARLTGEARRHAKAALEAGASDGRAENILSRLDGQHEAALAPAWECASCHARQAQWVVICPNCQSLGGLKYAPARSGALTIQG